MLYWSYIVFLEIKKILLLMSHYGFLRPVVSGFFKAPVHGWLSEQQEINIKFNLTQNFFFVKSVCKKLRSVNRPWHLLH